jgi:hypothetical protein
MADRESISMSANLGTEILGANVRAKGVEFYMIVRK